MVVLGIESSCDDCSIAIVKNGKEVLSVATGHQIENHKAFYGVVPEIASRLHAQSIDVVFLKAMEKSHLSSDKIDVVAVTHCPGLVGSLAVGVSFAKGLSVSLKKPLVGIDHILAHLYAPFLNPSPTTPELNYPYLAVLVSGGHTLIGKQTSFDTLEVLGRTLDDACGEAFDKVAKFYELGFPGGPLIDKLAKKGDESSYHFPIRRKDKTDNLDVSYSGLKTAVIHQSKKFLREGATDSVENLVASFQKAALTILFDKIEKALDITKLKTVVVAGGVASNSKLRNLLRTLAKKRNIQYFVPPALYCTDNAAMVAGLAYHKFLKKGSDSLDLEVYSRIDSYKKISL